MNAFYQIGAKMARDAIDMLAVIQCVEDVYAAKARGDAKLFPVITHEWQTDVKDMDIKSGYIGGDVNIHGLKLLTYIADNDKLGLPRLTGTMMVFDTVTGQLKGVLDSSGITGLRTGAAGAVGSKRLARKDSENVLLVGAGKQAFYNLAGNLLVMERIRNVSVWDPVNADNAQKFADTFKAWAEKEIARGDAYAPFLARLRAVSIDAAADPAARAKEADIIVTATPARGPLVAREWVTPGTHINCVGADLEGKQEIDGRILKEARVYADDIRQSMSIGETEIPIKDGTIREADIAGEIGQVIIGALPGRTGPADITVFDTSGLALQDLAVADLLIRRAEREGAPSYTLT